MRPLDHGGDEPPAEPSLFEQWMGMTPEEWEALGPTDDEAGHG
jgi:hypothetical protein